MNGIYWYNCIDKSKKHKGNLWMIAVVPRAGTWIETLCQRLRAALVCVVPRAGTWIETIQPTVKKIQTLRRSPCGNVD